MTERSSPGLPRTLSKRDRVWAALRGDSVDRPPISFWGHIYDRESSAADLVDATLEFHRAHDWDWVKLNPRKHYHVEDWGVRYRYSGREKPVLAEWPVHGIDDWARITERPADRGALGEQLEAVRALRRALPEAPIVETVFTPLAILAELVPQPEDLRDAMRAHPERVRPALQAITRTFERFVAAVMAAGADGIYLATTDWGSRDLIDDGEYTTWARPGDLRLLDAASGARFNVLHVCNRNNRLLELADYPVSAFSYDATDPTNPPLADALARWPAAFMGGISHQGSLQQHDARAALAELRRAYELTGGRHWLAAPGCSIPPTTPAANLTALRQAIGVLDRSEPAMPSIAPSSPGPRRSS